MVLQLPRSVTTIFLASIVLSPTFSLEENVCGVSYEPCPKGCWNANHRVDEGGHRLCAPVRPGFYGPYFEDRRFPCQPGTFSNIDTAEHCQLSPPGSFVSSAGATESTLCPPGTYSSDFASDACQECNPLFFNRSGSDSVIFLSAENTTDNNTTILYCMEPIMILKFPTVSPTPKVPITRVPTGPSKVVPEGTIMISRNSILPTATMTTMPMTTAVPTTMDQLTSAPTATTLMGAATFVTTMATTATHAPTRTSIPSPTPTETTTPTSTTASPTNQQMIEMKSDQQDEQEQHESQPNSTDNLRHYQVNFIAVVLTVVATLVLLFTLAFFAYKRTTRGQEHFNTNKTTTSKTILPLTEPMRQVEKDKASVTTTHLQDDHDSNGGDDDEDNGDEDDECEVDDHDDDDDKSATSKFDEIYLEGDDEEASKTRIPFPPVIVAPMKHHNHHMDDNEDAMTMTVAGGVSVWSFRPGVGNE